MKRCFRRALAWLTLIGVGCSAGVQGPAASRPSPANTSNKQPIPPASKDSKMTERIEKTEAQWRQTLTPEQFQVTRKHGTEPPFTGAYWNSKKAGVYQCVCCKLPLFSSEHKFDSGTGWPSYWQPINGGMVETESDNTLFTNRTEVHCVRCKAHLGHVFDDGPEPTGLRYCINSAALSFDEKR